MPLDGAVCKLARGKPLRLECGRLVLYNEAPEHPQDGEA